jgi:hypothetical protein
VIPLAKATRGIRDETDTVNSAPATAMDQVRIRNRWPSILSIADWA